LQRSKLIRFMLCVCYINMLMTCFLLFSFMFIFYWLLQFGCQLWEKSLLGSTNHTNVAVATKFTAISVLCGGTNVMNVVNLPCSSVQCASIEPNRRAIWLCMCAMYIKWSEICISSDLFPLVFIVFICK
jgi:hypothetical protein